MLMRRPSYSCVPVSANRIGACRSEYPPHATMPCNAAASSGSAPAMIACVAPNEKASRAMWPGRTSGRSASACTAARMVCAVRAGATRNSRHSGISGTKNEVAGSGKGTPQAVEAGVFAAGSSESVQHGPGRQRQAASRRIIDAGREDRGAATVRGFLEHHRPRIGPQVLAQEPVRPWHAGMWRRPRRTRQRAGCGRLALADTSIRRRHSRTAALAATPIRAALSCMRRREFLSAVPAAGLLWPVQLQALTDRLQRYPQAQGDEYWELVRSAFLVPDDRSYLNVGTLACSRGWWWMLCSSTRGAWP